MKKIFVFLFLLASTNAISQHWTDIHNYQKIDGVWGVKILTVPTDTVINKGLGSIAFLNGVLYVKYSNWMAVSFDSSGGGGGSAVNSVTADGFTGLIGDATTGDINLYIDTNYLSSHGWVEDLVNANLNTITGDTSNIAYIVDSIANTPTGSEIDGTKYLVGTSPTGTFSGHVNAIATLTSGVWGYVTPTSQQQIIVDNSTDYSTYQYNGTAWVQTSILWRVGGNGALGNNAWFGRIDNKPIVFKIRKREVARFNIDSTLSMPKFVGITNNNYAKWDSATGKLTYIIPSGGGGGAGTVTSVTSATGDATVANTTTTPVITINSAPKLTTARTIASVPFDGTANISLNNNAITNGAGYTTVAGAKAALSLTTTGSSGAATYDNSTGVFNIPNYAGGAASKFGKDDILGSEPRLFDANNYNFSIVGADTLLLSGDNVFLGEGVAKMSMQSLGTTEILSTDSVNVTGAKVNVTGTTNTNINGVNTKAYGSTSNYWGQSSSLGFQTDASKIYEKGILYRSNPANKILLIDTVTGQHSYGLNGLGDIVQGDINYGSATGVYSTLAKNTTAQRVLTNGGTSNNPIWDQVDLTNGVKNALPETKGGTNQSSYTTGDLLYASGTNTLSKLGIGTTGQLLTVASGIPSWATVSTSPFTRGPVATLGAYTLNVIHPTIQSDSVFFGTAIGFAPSAKFQFMGTGYFSSSLRVDGGINTYNTASTFNAPLNLLTANFTSSATSTASLKEANYNLFTATTALNSTYNSAVTGNTYFGMASQNLSAYDGKKMYGLYGTFDGATSGGSGTPTTGFFSGVYGLAGSKLGATNTLTMYGVSGGIYNYSGLNLTAYSLYAKGEDGFGGTSTELGGLLIDSIKTSSLKSGVPFGIKQKGLNMVNFLAGNTMVGYTSAGAVVPVASAALQVNSTTQGFLPPRMTATQRTAISSPNEGLIVYDLTLHRKAFYDGTAWQVDNITITGIVAPTSTPTVIGDKFIDTVLGKVYFATGTSSSADWTIVN